MLNRTIVAAFIATSAVAFGVEARPLISESCMASPSKGPDAEGRRPMTSKWAVGDTEGTRPQRMLEG